MTFFSRLKHDHKQGEKTTNDHEKKHDHKTGGLRTFHAPKQADSQHTQPCGRTLAKPRVGPARKNALMPG
jgi:hypothetical protein